MTKGINFESLENSYESIEFMYNHCVDEIYNENEMFNLDEKLESL